MATIYEKILKFNNSKVGLTITGISGLILAIMFTFLLVRFIEKKNTLFVFASIFYIGLGLFGLIKTIIKAKRLSNSNHA